MRQPLEVPDLTGKSEAEALALLAASGLDAGGIRYVTSGAGSPGSVLAQIPLAGALVLARMTVDLDVAVADPSSQIKCDFNKDGSVTRADLSGLLLSPKTTDGKLIGDLDGDGRYTSQEFVTCFYRITGANTGR